MSNLSVYLHMMLNILLSAAITPLVMYICLRIGEVVDLGKSEPAIGGTIVLVTMCYVLKEMFEEDSHLSEMLKWNMCEKRGIPFRVC